MDLYAVATGRTCRGKLAACSGPRPRTATSIQRLQEVEASQPRRGSSRSPRRARARARTPWPSPPRLRARGGGPLRWSGSVRGWGWPSQVKPGDVRGAGERRGATARRTGWRPRRRSRSSRAAGVAGVVCFWSATAQAEDGLRRFARRLRRALHRRYRGRVADGLVRRQGHRRRGRQRDAAALRRDRDAGVQRHGQLHPAEGHRLRRSACA